MNSGRSRAYGGDGEEGEEGEESEEGEEGEEGEASQNPCRHFLAIGQ